MSLYEEEPRAKCVIYSFGVNHETRFEGEMLERTDCEIWAYDASVTEMGVGKVFFLVSIHRMVVCMCTRQSAERSAICPDP